MLDARQREVREALHAGRRRVGNELGGAVFCNPPYGREIGKWVAKAAREAEKGATVVLLLPARTDTAWFHDFLYGRAEIRFLRGRLRFCIDGIPGDAAPFPSMVAILKPKPSFANPQVDGSL